MNVQVQAVAPAEVNADTLAVPLTEDGLTESGRAIDGALDGLLQQLLQVGELRSDLGYARFVHAGGKLAAKRVAAAGLGEIEAIDADAVRTAAAAVAQETGEFSSSIAWALDPSLPLPVEEQARAHVEADALGPERIREQGMGAFAAVAQGSDTEPRLVVLRYEPAQPAKSDLVLGLVGKAITFDTGGISLKPSLHMQDMKGDMAGGAAVIEATGAIADLGLPIRVISVVAACENMPGGHAYRPGDILTAANGKTIEVTNTDAEGRLVLADALWYARENGATHILDLATLTGAMELALGDLYAGVFSNDDEWREQVVAAGEASGDHAWEFPLHPRYRRYVDSAFADLKNSSDLRQASPALAAAFLQEFVGEGAWAHADIAGPAFLERPRGDYLSQRGGTGYGVRLIVELARRLGGPARQRSTRLGPPLPPDGFRSRT